MHTFLFPSNDTYITNQSIYANKNFGIDEILELKSTTEGISVTDAYEDAKIIDTNYLFMLTVISYNGTNNGYVSGSGQLSGYTRNGYGSIPQISTFSGSLTTASIVANIATGSHIMSASLNGVTYTNTLWSNPSVIVSGSVENFTGSISGSIYTGIGACMDTGSLSGSMSGAFNGWISSYSGSIINLTGTLSGSLSGSFLVSYPKVTVINNPVYSRVLLKFNIDELSSSLQSGNISGSNIKFILSMKVANQSSVPFGYTIYGYPVSQSWEQGDGRFATDGSNYGCSWLYRTSNYITASNWFTVETSSYSSDDYLTNEYYKTSSFKHGGGTWYYAPVSSYTNKNHWICSSSYYSPLSGSSLICSQSFSFNDESDLTMDITNIVRGWICGCTPNEGIILISSKELETVPDHTTNGAFKFFSKETNTIYSPYIDIQWDDSVYSTGSLAPVTSSVPFTIALNNVKSKYKFGSFPRINMVVRDKYPMKTFDVTPQQPSYTTSKYLPSSSYYSIKDNESEETIIKFDEYTKLSCNGTHHYFMLDTTGLPQERYYRILIKTELSDGTVEIFDNNTIFKIVR